MLISTINSANMLIKPLFKPIKRFPSFSFKLHKLRKFYGPKPEAICDAHSQTPLKQSLLFCLFPHPPLIE